MSPTPARDTTKKGVSVHITITIAEKDLPRFWEAFNPVFEAVRAEPECDFFEAFTLPEEPGRITFVEDWTESKEWFMENQVTKEYYKEYFAITEPMFIKERVVRVLEPVGAPYFMCKRCQGDQESDVKEDTLIGHAMLQLTKGSPSRPDDVAEASKAVLTAIEAVTENADWMRASGTGMDDLERDLKSLQTAVMLIRERGDELSKPPVPESTKTHTYSIVMACKAVVVKMAAVTGNIDRGKPVREDTGLEALQSTLRVYTSALNLSLDVLSVSSEAKTLSESPRSVTLELTSHPGGTTASVANEVGNVSYSMEFPVDGGLNAPEKVSLWPRDRPLVLDYELEEGILPSGYYPKGEFSHLRLTQVTVSGHEFGTSEAFRLRPTLFASPRQVDIFLSIHLSNPNHILPAFNKLPAEFDALDAAVAAGPIPSGGARRPFGEEGWKHRIIHLHCPLYPLKDLALALHDLGARPLVDRSMGWGLDFDKGGRGNTAWTIFEHTTRMRLEQAPLAANKKNETKYSARHEATSQPMQVIVTHGGENISTTGDRITVVAPGLFRPTWSEIREGLRKKLQANMTVYADSAHIARYTIPQLLEHSWNRRSDSEGMSEPVSLEPLASENVLRPLPPLPPRPLIGRLFPKRGP